MAKIAKSITELIGKTPLLKLSKIETEKKAKAQIHPCFRIMAADLPHDPDAKPHTDYNEIPLPKKDYLYPLYKHFLHGYEIRTPCLLPYPKPAVLRSPHRRSPPNPSDRTLRSQIQTGISNWRSRHPRLRPLMNVPIWQPSA